MSVLSVLHKNTAAAAAATFNRRSNKKEAHDVR